VKRLSIGCCSNIVAIFYGHWLLKLSLRGAERRGNLKLQAVRSRHCVRDDSALAYYLNRICASTVNPKPTLLKRSPSTSSQSLKIANTTKVSPLAVIARSRATRQSQAPGSEVASLCSR